VVSDLELGSLLAHCIDAGGALPYLALVTAANPGGLRELLGRRTRLDDDEPTLSDTVRFARDQFQKPLAEVVLLLRSNVTVVDPRALGADAATARHLSELITEGYRANEPRPIERDGRSLDPALLTLSRAAVRLDPSSELLAAYDVVRWFIMRYRADLADSNLADHERARVRAVLREEARLLGVEAGRLVGVIARTEEIARHAGIDLGAQEPAPRMPDDLLARLVSDGRGGRPDTDAVTRRREVLRVYRHSLNPRPSAALPEPTAEERHRFVRAIDQLRLFVPVELTAGEDARGYPILQGTVPQRAGLVTVTIEHGRTSLRPQGRAQVRGRVVAIPYIDAEGKDALRHTLSLASVMV
jgi:hypothetical protein